mmetsp:Transcript_15815/g.14312  ORF Transcript_15815/g.14312 Transcript_15815/m.14312 type:complete len:578 (+) Transcript_15815:34-1767(+)
MTDNNIINNNDIDDTVSQRETVSLNYFNKSNTHNYSRLTTDPEIQSPVIQNSLLKEKLLSNLNEHTTNDDNTGQTKKINKLASQIITSVSNFSVQYNFQAISVALLIMSDSVCTSSEKNCKDGIQAPWVSGTLTATVFIGAIVGQLTMGYAGDIFGRNRAMLFTLSLASFGALLSAVVPNGDATSIYAILIAFRFILGIGLGGVYPLSATKAAESGNDNGKVDLWTASWAFFWQTPGAMTPWMIAFLMTYGSLSNDFKWRMILAIGFIPGIIVLISSSLEEKEQLDTLKDRNNISIWSLLKEREMQKKLLVTGGAWYIYDICFYGVNLFGGEILENILPNNDDNVSSNSAIRDVTSRQLIALSTSIPACILTIYLVKPIGTKLLQVYGFTVIAFFFLGLSGLCLLDSTPPAILFTVYCGLLFCLSAGPNLTTFILPAEQYPKNVRSTFNGISAALGKLGAVTGAYLYGPLANVSSYVIVMLVCANLSLIGAIITFIGLEEDFDADELRELDRELFLNNTNISNNPIINPINNDINNDVILSNKENQIDNTRINFNTASNSNYDYKNNSYRLPSYNLS